MVMIIIIIVVITIITLIYAARGDIDDDMNCKKGTDNDGIISDDDDNDGIKDNDDDNDDDNASSPERSIKLAHVPPWIPCMMMIIIMCVVMMKRDLTPMTFVVVFTRSVRLLLCLRAGCVCAQLVFVVVFARRVAQNRSEYAILKQQGSGDWSRCYGDSLSL